MKLKPRGFSDTGKLFHIGEIFFIMYAISIFYHPQQHKRMDIAEQLKKNGSKGNVCFIPLEVSEKDVRMYILRSLN